ncbi:outer membrane protein assembly factor BamE [Candidatus Macondimonas diazotrophica]|jgi:outer membrane protein assembly factor BamE|uniref:Outer membrane protein assembly factor BamE n=1 Tax=Candidatus Macondimonas diazotrophica TaxID=2305248 RepID=A0A4Z0F9L3_9GAMM|nr:outer membrane protein assembly factor BamE [Candidatus Macondimonas diazotrophica]MDY6955588.1 outer membrane protein assembly factor BamE [Pseudomonadota bacterium]HBG31586.1 outer membrane protein assembly factor BamE [Gammaproteobacteria bacterium]NCU01929.1 outer membrane protein assembly factor BamE [Candidatus Macondimonas diazotrophica]TFZ82491.1 outer membrane protein assembly factor BamE [Candidatus Macondimonas diazotrophica]HBG52456.1 outer membrane protein assembly factor BamE 
MKRPLLLLTLSLGVLLSGCFVYKPDLRQGNSLSRSSLSQLAPGLTRDQVQYLLGRPVLKNLFDDNRWDYVFYHRSRRDKETCRLTVFFEQDRLARVEHEPQGEEFYACVEKSSRVKPNKF